MKKKKRNVLLPALMILLSAIFISVIPTEAEGAVYDDTLRLHILAASDSARDQEFKIYLRDKILSEYSSVLSVRQSKEEAERILKESLGEITEFANSIAKEEGYEQKIRAEFGNEWYDTREYGDITLPRGYYSSLRIIIGDGDGQNWWCVIYPPLCLDVACENAPTDDAVKKYSDEEFTLISKNGYNVKFKILELVSGLFS